jgi:hypothetical protein
VRLRVPARGPVMLRVREAGHCNGVNPPMHVPLARR